jgi:hypothetical protein
MKGTFDLSKPTFDEMVKLSNAMRDRAADQKDWQAYRDADRMNALICRFATDLVVEGHIP